jgi:hypothetical protein
MPRAIEHINQEEDEMLLIVVTNAIIDPRAMMIHSSNASFASRAVMRMGRLDTVTLLALFGKNLIQESNIPCIDNN